MCITTTTADKQVESTFSCEITSSAEGRCLITGQAKPGRKADVGVYWFAVVPGGVKFSKAGGETNTVWFRGGAPASCTCKDHEMKRRACKHMLAARVVLAETF